MAKQNSQNRSLQIVNRIRIAMGLVYIGMVATLAPTFTDRMLMVQAVAIGVYLITVLVFWILFARGKLTIKNARFFIFLTADAVG